ncbi:MAG TPA: RusA family crossover junction endodeoxyribonuclease [Candidatus Saccharimonadales bacterium]|nr:RusA family crossover junction endodeoxyribonuclease [Candidatus Saccharimonadales bacterium]
MIVVKLKPVGKPRMTRRDVWKQRPVVMVYRAYGDELRLKLPHYELPGELRIVFHLPMPQSWSEKKKAAMDGVPHKQKPDVDNLLKGFMDHLAKDDSHVWRVEAMKIWSRTGKITIF